MLLSRLLLPPGVAGGQVERGVTALRPGAHYPYLCFATMPTMPLTLTLTWQVGKWNAGSLLYGQVPTERGFETSLGYMGGQEDHYTQVRVKVRVRVRVRVRLRVLPGLLGRTRGPLHAG